jgi:hypothetical protein
MQQAGEDSSDLVFDFITKQRVLEALPFPMHYHLLKQSAEHHNVLIQQ